MVRACCAKTFNELFPTFDQKSRELTAQRDKEGEPKIAIDDGKEREGGGEESEGRQCWQLSATYQQQIISSDRIFNQKTSDTTDSTDFGKYFGFVLPETRLARGMMCLPEK